MAEKNQASSNSSFEETNAKATMVWNNRRRCGITN